jgi:hypothetical protein
MLSTEPKAKATDTTPIASSSHFSDLNMGLDLFGDRLPSAVNDDVALSFVEDHLTKSGHSYNTQRRKLNPLVAFWRWSPDSPLRTRARHA